MGTRQNFRPEGAEPGTKVSEENSPEGMTQIRVICPDVMRDPIIETVVNNGSFARQRDRREESP